MNSAPIAVTPGEWKIIADVLARHVPELEVWAFGSRAVGTPKPWSDLDLALVTDSPLSLRVSAALADAFSESDLPWKVDVIDCAAVTNPGFLGRIAAHHVVIQRPSSASAGGVGTSFGC